MIELQKFIEQQKNPNTKRKTLSDMGIWTRWCKSVGELRHMEDIPPLELNRLLGHFFISIKRQNGMVYEPGTLTSFQKSFDRYLKEKGRTYSIVKDSIFATSQQSLKSST